MKNLICSWLLLFGVSAGAQSGAFLNSFGEVNLIIPDGNLNGIQSSQTVVGEPGTVSDVNVSLNIAGGFNGDYYAYLYHNNTIAVLLNRAGRSSTSAFGYADGGFGADTALNPFTFDDQAGRDVHFYRAGAFALNPSGQLTGQWQPDGRIIDPIFSPGSAFDTAPRLDRLSGFNGMDPNGLWLLFVADVSSGGQGTLVNWGLQVTTVPEPSTATILLAFLGLAALKGARRTSLQRQKNHC